MIMMWLKSIISHFNGFRLKSWYFYEPVMPSSNYLHIQCYHHLEGVNVSLVLNFSELIPDSMPEKIVFRMFPPQKKNVHWAHRVYDKLRMIIPKVAYVYSSSWRYRKKRNEGRKRKKIFFSSWSVRNHLRWRRTFSSPLRYALLTQHVYVRRHPRGVWMFAVLPYHMEHINLDNNLLCSCFSQECNDGE